MNVTTMGRLLLNDALPDGYKVPDGQTWTKTEADDALARLAAERPDDYRAVSHRLMQVAASTVYRTGTTLKLSDTLNPVPERGAMLDLAEAQADAIRADKKLTPEQKREAVIGVYSATNDKLREMTYKNALAAGNPFAIQVASKARGNKSQLASLMTTPGLYEDAHGNTIPFMIRRSYAEGLTPAEYFASTFGARKSIIATKFATADAGYLGKLYASALAPMVVTEDDCGTHSGLPVPAGDVDNLGGVLARDAGGFKAGTVVNRQVLAGLKKTGAERILLRSPTVCRAAEGVCRRCTGLRENGKFPEIGDNVGMNAAAAIAERIAQGSLNTKHSGGAASTKDPDSLAGFDVVRDLAMVPSSFPHAATVASLDGRVEDVRQAPQGGFYVTIGGQQHYALGQPQVKPGDEVEAGDVLNAGIVNPRDVVEHKGIGAGREYFTRRYTRALRDTGYEVNRRNVELLARANINHVRSDEFDGDLLPGDVQQYNKWQATYQPREDAREVAADGAVGQYLERPVAHHTIGSRVTRSMLKDIKDWDPDQKLLVHPKPPGVSAHMESLQYVPQHYPDWQAQLGSNYLERGLLRNVHRGASSDTAGLHPIPRVARGVGLSSDAV